MLGVSVSYNNSVEIIDYLIIPEKFYDIVCTVVYLCLSSSNIQNKMHNKRSDVWSLCTLQLWCKSYLLFNNS